MGGLRRASQPRHLADSHVNNPLAGREEQGPTQLTADDKRRDVPLLLLNLKPESGALDSRAPPIVMFIRDAQGQTSLGTTGILVVKMQQSRGTVTNRR